MKKKGLILISVLILAIFVSLYFDSEIVKGVTSLRSDTFDSFMVKVALICSEIFIFLFLTILFLWKKSKRKWVLPLWVTIGLSAVVSFLLKSSIQRQRPFQLGICMTMNIFQKASHFIWNYSFPSFHTMFVFSVLPLISKEFPKLKYVWIVFASVVGFSRIYFGVHFLSDVLAGGLIGYGIGLFILKIEKENKFFERIYKKIVKK